MQTKSTENMADGGAAPTAGAALRSALLPIELTEGAYRVRFARGDADLDQVLRLRFRVFNEELGEGLEESWGTGRDEDSFDRICHHLMLVDTRTDELVGTYRMQTAEMARSGIGFYCDQEFDLDGLPGELLDDAIELGRACIAREHRSGMALFALWRGLALYLTFARKNLLFGCCSLTSQDPRDGWAMLRYLERRERFSGEYRVQPREGFDCELPAGAEVPEFSGADVPKLFGTYLRYGALALGEPAIDRAFRTIDFLILLDSRAVDPRMRALFFSGLPEAPSHA